ncbi:uncharacterized protein UTRI_03147_B [Ustilago trichophora]|uniref:Uncharacterized protein n=1 Tax=Ustilago trichophora TaxID=86804 RepID=A0A5C3E5R4_9BASI|nr:uncharacterized protein UTRI_03147_B [Ustilago trichophora]
MSTTLRGRQQQYMTSHKAEAMYRQSSYDRSFDSVRYPSNASQPSLSHSINTYTESTPSSVCRPDFGDYPQDMSQSDCGASFVSEVPASYDDTSDIDEAPVNNNSKPTLIKFVEPVVQRDHSNGNPRLTGMKKKMQRKKTASTMQHEGDIDVHHLPVLGFADSGIRYASSDDGLHKDTLHFPGVPPRDQHLPTKQEQWNVDAIDIALEDLVLDKGKARLTLNNNTTAQGPFADAGDATATQSIVQLRRTMTGMRAAAAQSVFDEAQEDERQYLPKLRPVTLSDTKRQQRPAAPKDAPLPPLPPLPSPLVNSQDSNTTPSASSGKVAGLQPIHDHPLATNTGAAQLESVGNSVVVASTPDDEENVFAFSPPSISGHGHGEDQLGTIPEPRIPRATGKRLDSMASSNHSSLRDMDPREVIQRARMQPMSCGLDAEIGGAADLASECNDFDSGDHGVQAEDLPPLLSNHYLQSNVEQGKLDQTEYERLNRLPERMQAAAAAAAAAAASSGSHRLSHKHLSKHKKTAGAPSAVNHYEPISILRAEAAFLKEDLKKDKKKKDRLWNSSSSSSSGSVAGRSSQQPFGRAGVNQSTSDISSSHSDGPQRLRSFKSSIRLKNMK